MIKNFCAALFALTALVASPQAEAGGFGWPWRVQKYPPVVEQAGIVTGTPSAQPCPQGAGLGDGCPMTSIGNGVGTVQHADFFTGYAAQTSIPQAAAIASGSLPPRAQYTTRPGFNVAGVDYPVGVPAGTVLKDPVQAYQADPTSLPNKCQIGTTAGANAGEPDSYVLDCNGSRVGSAGNGCAANALAQNCYTVLTLDGWDFQKNNVAVNVGNWKGEVRFTRNKVGGNGTTNQSKAMVGWLNFQLNYNVRGDACMGRSDGCILIANNWLDGRVFGHHAGDGFDWGIDIGFLSQGFTVTYNYISNTNGRSFTQGNSVGANIVDYCNFDHNYFEGWINSEIKISTPHNEIALTGGPCGHLNYRYNTMLQPTRNGGNGTTPGSSVQNGFDMTAFIFPGYVKTAICNAVTFTGTTGTVQGGGCGGPEGGVGGATFKSKVDDQYQRTPLNADTFLKSIDGSGTVINGHVVAINGKGPGVWDGSEIITSFTMDAQNEISTPVQLNVGVVIPEIHIDHNVGVTNYWDVGATEFGYMVGPPQDFVVDTYQMEANWWDITGAYACYAPTSGALMTDTIARARHAYVSGDFDLKNGGLPIDPTSKAPNGTVGGATCSQGYGWNGTSSIYSSRYGQP